MKRRTSLFLTVIILLLATSCGGPSRQAEQKADPIQTPSFAHKADPVGEMFSKGRYHLECTAYFEGKKSKVSITVQGSNTNTEIDWMGFSLRALDRDGKNYSINAKRKVYSVSAAEGWLDTVQNGLAKKDSMRFVKRGRETIEDLKDVDGNKYDFEQYASGKGDRKAKTVYYFKGNKLYAITTKVSKYSMTMVVTKLTHRIPKGAMEIPKGYKKVKASQVYQ